MPGDVTLGEVSRKLDDLTEDVRILGTKVEDRPSWRDIQRVETGLVRRVQELEDWKTWAERLVLGVVLTGIIAAYFIIKP